jgi:inner membrane protein
VRLVEPVNIYSMADRALKHGFLFVTLSFAAFLLFELIKALRIHPAQSPGGAGPGPVLPATPERL